MDFNFAIAILIALVATGVVFALYYGFAILSAYEYIDVLSYKAFSIIGLIMTAFAIIALLGITLYQFLKTRKNSGDSNSTDSSSDSPGKLQKIKDLVGETWRNSDFRNKRALEYVKGKLNKCSELVGAMDEATFNSINRRINNDNMFDSTRARDTGMNRLP